MLLRFADAVEATLELQVALLLVGAAHVVAKVVFVAALGKLNENQECPSGCGQLATLRPRPWSS